MPEWREQIVRRFVPKVARVTAVSDPDGLLRDPGIFQAIQAGGFSIVQFEDSVSFRYDYESRFRSKWDVGGDAELVVVFKPGEREFETCRRTCSPTISACLHAQDFFPEAVLRVVSQLVSIHFDALYRDLQSARLTAHEKPRRAA